MRTTYYTILHQNPQIRLCWFLPLIKRAVETGKGITTKEPIPLNGLDYTLYFVPEVQAGANGEITLSLQWEDEGETYRQQIPILREESNLVSGSFVYYFLCPYGYKSKKLFYIGCKFRSRRSFRHGYSSQNQSHHQRDINSTPEPYRRYGKQYYRDKLTPYGKRCKRFEEKEERQFEAIMTFIGKCGKRISKLNHNK